MVGTIGVPFAVRESVGKRRGASEKKPKDNPAVERRWSGSFSGSDRGSDIHFVGRDALG